MAAVDNGSKRNLTVLAVVVACFAVLWPKIFYPMVQSILFPRSDHDEEAMEDIKKMHISYLHPHMREAMGEARPPDKLLKDSNRAMIHPSLRHNLKPQSKGAGAANLVIPVYTIGIILFFIYTLFKMSFNKPVIPLSKESQKVICLKKLPEIEENQNQRKETVSERKTQRALEQYGKDKVLTALKTIILEMEDLQTTGENDLKLKILSGEPIENEI